MSREALASNKPTALSNAISFLSEDYEAMGKGTFWWEPLEMCRKLVLCGWVLLISEHAEQARLVVALLVSITFLDPQVPGLYVA